MTNNIELIISAFIAAAIAISGLPGIWQQARYELGIGPRPYGQRPNLIRRTLQRLRQKWRTDMQFYTYWIKLRRPRKEAWQAAQSVIE